MFIIIIALCRISRLYHRAAADGPMSQWMREYILGKLSYIVGTRRERRRSYSNATPITEATVASETDERKESYEVALINASKGKVKEAGRDFRYTEEEEWYVVATTLD